MSNTPPTERRLIIATRLGDDSEYIECSVTDGGHGIPAHSLDRIFEPRVTTKGNGLGLGLAICRSIIEAHGGRLWAENASRGGAVFRFTAKRVLG
jgi:signal transduction histidine kinase